MTCLVRLTSALLICAALGLATPSHAQQPQSPPQRPAAPQPAPPACKTTEADERVSIPGRVSCSYFLYQGLNEWLKRIRLLENVKFILSPLRLPYEFDMRVDTCGMANAFYSPDKRSITVCFELITQVLAPRAPPPGQRTAEGLTRDEMLQGAIAAVLLHELGHALFDILGVPMFGREEDAADQIAILIALNHTRSRELARIIVGGFAHTWRAGASQQGPVAWATFADEHGTAPQRYYNALCLAYGFDRLAFKEFAERKVEDGGLPPGRAANCAAEYQQVLSAYNRTVGPFLDKPQFDDVRSHDWAGGEAR